MPRRLSEFTCTCCGAPLPFEAQVTIIASAYVAADWEEIIECDEPNQETLCQTCTDKLNHFLRDLYERGA